MSRKTMLVGAGLLMLAGTGNATDLGPAPIQTDSGIKIEATRVGTMPFVLGPGLIGGTFGPNLQSPVPIRDRLYFIDQNDAIYRDFANGKFEKIFSIEDGDATAELSYAKVIPDGKGGTIDYQQRQAVFNVSEGPTKDSLSVVLVSVSDPQLGVPHYSLPDPIPGPCCVLPFPPYTVTGAIADLYAYSGECEHRFRTNVNT